MDCRTFEQRLEDLLAGTLAPDEALAVERHRGSCPRCRELHALAGGGPDLPPVEPPADLTGTILARTSGSPCGRARELLCGHVDGGLDPVEAELVRLHLDGCGDCAALAAVLVRMGEDLPMLAERRPDESFVDDVLAATIPWRRRVARRLSRGWSRLVERPRFALEGAYLGSVVLVLLFVLPGSPLAGVPQRALDIASMNPILELKQPVTRLEDRIASDVRTAWNVTSTAAAETARQVGADVARRSGTAFEKVRNDLGTLWDRLTSEQETNEDDRSAGDDARDRNDGDE